VDITSLATPSVLVDRARLLANLDRMQAAASKTGVRLRPHAKTHKSPAIARWQLERGAVGICCAKLGEAEVFAGHGIEDIRLPYPLSPANAGRVLALAGRVRLSFIVDDLDVARQWSEVMTKAGRRIEVLVKVDVGFHRCGIDPALPVALDFVRAIDAMPGLELRGLLSHAGHSYAAQSDDELEAVAASEGAMLNSIAAAARHEGVAIEELSVGATPTARFSLGLPGVTELRPGNYAYFDRTQVALGAARFADCAMTVLARVVSKPAADRIILDSGSKTLSTDTTRAPGATEGFGVVCADLEALAPDDTLVIERLSEEHATVKVRTGTTALSPGDLVRVVPNHACVVSNLVDSVVLMDGPNVIDSLPIAARGKIT
jgi:D-serine deaminase-like pyridoxal phosphate-dependent protein